MFFINFFNLIHIAASLNAKKFIIGEWSIYTKSSELPLYTIEFHHNLNRSNKTNNLNNSIAGSFWLNKNETDEEDQFNIYNPDNFLAYSFELSFTTSNEGTIETINQMNENKDISFFCHSNFHFVPIENKSVIISINSTSLKILCTFVNSTFGIVNYSILGDGIADGNEIYILKNRELTFFQWNKLIAYIFYGVFILTFCRTIFITRSFLLQKSRENSNINEKSKMVKKENFKSIEKNHPKSE